MPVNSAAKLNPNILDLASLEQKPTREGFGLVAVLISAATLTLIVGGSWYAYVTSISGPGPGQKCLLGSKLCFFAQTVCTQEVKLCPDGKTSVGREGPNCEFAKCPQETAQQVFISQDECEKATGKECAVQPCEQNCSFGVIKEWVVKSNPLTIMSTWQPYRNEVYGFALKYPQYGTAQVVKENKKLYPTAPRDFLSRIEFRANLDPASNDKYEAVFTIDIYNNPSKSSLREWFTAHVDEKNQLLTSGAFKESVRADGSALITTSGGQNSAASFTHVLMSLDGSKVFVFYSAYDVYNDVSFADEMPAIIETFEFLPK